MSAAGRVAVSFAAAIFFLFSVPETQALQIKQVDTKKAVMERGQNKIRLDLEMPVDPQKTLIFLQFKVVSPDRADPFSTRPAAYLSGRQAVYVVREKGDAVLHVQVMAAEFKEGIRVHSGVSHFPADIYQKGIALPHINASSAVPFLMVTTPGFDQEGGEYLYFSARFPDSTTLRVERIEAKEIPLPEDAVRDPLNIKRVTMPEATVYWQVAEFISGARIHSGIAKLPHFGKDTNAYLVESLKNLQTAFLIFHYVTGHESKGRDSLAMVRGLVADRNILRFDRGRKGERRGEDAFLQWYVTELETHGGFIQRGTLHFAQGESSRTFPIQAIEARRLVLLVSATPVLEESAADGGLWPQVQFTAELSSAESLTIQRGEGEGRRLIPADVNWVAIEFAPVTLLQPNGGEVWHVGETKEILWNYSDDLSSQQARSQAGQPLELRLSLDGGRDQFPYLLAADLPVTSGRYAWDVPEEIEFQNPLGRDLLLKILLPHLSEHNLDVSARPFHIKGVLNLIQPDGGEIWHAGDTGREIRWNYKGNLGILSLYYDKESGFGVDPFPPHQRIARVAHGENGSGSFLWDPVPDISSFRVRVKVVSEDDPSVYDTSKRDLTIVPKLLITYPDQGSEIFSAGKYHTIQWQNSGTVSALNLYYSHGEGGEWVLAAQNIQGGKAGEYQFPWLVPAEAVSENVRLKIEHAGEPRIFDTAPDGVSGYFAIRSWIRLASPSFAGEIWRVGEERVITWEAGGRMQYLRFEYSTDAGKSWIQESFVNAQEGKYAWTVPDRISDDVLLRLSDVKTGALFDVARFPLSIKGALEIQAPSGGEKWIRGGLGGEIKWKSAGSLGTVSLYYDRKDGQEGYPRGNLIASGIAHDQGSFLWEPLGDINSRQIRIKIVQDTDPAVYGETQSAFSIQPVLKIMAPAPELQNWLAEKPLRIHWHTTGTLERFALYYRTDAGSEWIPADQNIPGGPGGDYEYHWKVPSSLIGSRVVFKVAFEGEPAVEGMWTPQGSSGLRIDPWIELKRSPGPQSPLYTGDSYPIEWSYSGDIRFIKIEYSLDAGKNWFEEAVLSAPAGAHSWKVPERPGAKVLFRLSKLNDPELYAINETPFVIE